MSKTSMQEWWASKDPMARHDACPLLGLACGASFDELYEEDLAILSDHLGDKP